MLFRQKVSQNYPAHQKIVIFRQPAIEKNDLSLPYQKMLLQSGAVWVQPLPLINGALCFFPRPADFRALARSDEIFALEDNFQVKLHPVFGQSKSLVFNQDRRQIIPWGVQRIGADQAWSVSRGEKVKVGVLDTGVEISHPDLKDNYQGGRNFLAPDTFPWDDNGHGTHVAGIIAAVDNGFGILGVSPGVSFYALKVLNARGEGYFSEVISALDWCVQNSVEVINLSFGSDQPGTALREAVKKVVAAGSVIVAAAGNDGTDQSVDYPAAYPEVISVGAVDEFDQIAPFTSRGPELGLVAPGTNILSTARKGFFMRLSGTSMAAAHVTGAVAILKRLLPEAGHGKILKILQASAEKLSFYSKVEQGAGLVRMDKAVSLPARFAPAGAKFRPGRRGI